MSTFKHTPGPWVRIGTTVYALMHDGWKRGFEQFKNRFTVQVQRDRECSEEEAEANARLIAAAPDLLEALRPFAELDMRPDGFDKRDDSQPIYARDNSVITVGDVRRAVAAIAKATQEPQE
jgi:hypothetical protein